MDTGSLVPNNIEEQVNIVIPVVSVFQDCKSQVQLNERLHSYGPWSNASKEVDILQVYLGEQNVLHETKA